MNWTLSATDWTALAVFLSIWLAYNWFTDRGPRSRNGLSGRMNRERHAWMSVASRRDLRMIDTAIMASLQQGAGFFASSSIFAIGGCFALLGSADVIAAIAADLAPAQSLDKPLVEFKLLGLVVIFCYGFFKFAWSYRLFNYCAILLGALPTTGHAVDRPEDAERALRKAQRMNVIAGRHFNAGLRAIFFALAYLGWFLGPFVLMASTTVVVFIIGNRQFRSSALHALDDDDEETRP